MSPATVSPASSVRRRIAVTALVLPVATPAALPVAHAAAGLGAGGEYHPLIPARVFDSRSGLPGSEFDVAPLGAKPVSTAGSTFDIQLLGRGGVPTDAGDVLGVVVNITVTDTNSNGYLNAYGKGAAAGIAAIVNFTPGATVPNLAIVRPGADGQLTINLAAGTGSAQRRRRRVRLVLHQRQRVARCTPGARDARSRSSTPASGSAAPARLRSAAGEVTTLEIRGVDAVDPSRPDIVPDDPDVVGVVLNMAGVNNLAHQRGHAPVGHPERPADRHEARHGEPQPRSGPGQVEHGDRAGRPDRRLDPRLQQLGDHARGARRRRLPDRRPARGAPAPVGWCRSPHRSGCSTLALRSGAAVPLGPGNAEDWSFADFAGSVTIAGVPVGAQLGVIGNLTSASLTRQYPTQAVGSYLTVYPSDAERPTSANLNTVENQITPNMVIMKYSSSGASAPLVRVYNYAGYDHYVYDASAVILSD